MICFSSPSCQGTLRQNHTKILGQKYSVGADSRGHLATDATSAVTTGQGPSTITAHVERSRGAWSLGCRTALSEQDNTLSFTKEKPGCRALLKEGQNV